MNREFSAGGVVFKVDKETTFWLIRRSKPSTLYPEEDRWTLPKGWLEKDEKPEQAALREVEEEAWVKARVVEKLIDQRLVYTPRGGEKTFKINTYYLMEYLENSSASTDSETAEATWLPYTEARKKLVYSGEKKVLDLAREKVERML
jgi:8-oxo-dGTP pyrophosphatase MutT (NUDIX family)